LLLLNICFYGEPNFKFHLVGSRLFLQQVLIQITLGQDLQQDLMLENEENRNGMRCLKERLLLREPYHIQLGSFVSGTCGIPYEVLFEGNRSLFVVVELPSAHCPKIGNSHYYYISVLRASQG
jgi:hypothetical protein